MVQPVWRTGPIYAPDALKRFLIMGCVYFSRGRRTPTITIRSFLRDAYLLEPMKRCLLGRFYHWNLLYIKTYLQFLPYFFAEYQLILFKK